jgi:anti-sigma B factor antagonist
MASPESIFISVLDSDQIAIIKVSGDVDSYTAPALDQAVAEALAGSPAGLIIDLSAVKFLASAGLRVLVTTHQQITAPTTFGVVAKGPAAYRPIELVRLHDMFSVYPSLDAALAGARTPSA